MSKRCELQKEYYKEKGNYKGDGKYSDDYVAWLEDKIVKSNVDLADVRQQSELLKAFIDWNNKNNGIADGVPKEMAFHYIESLK